MNADRFHGPGIPPAFAIALPALPLKAARVNAEAFPPGLNTLIGKVYGVGWDPGVDGTDRAETVRYLVMTRDLFEWVDVLDWDFTPFSFGPSAFQHPDQD